jgi:hypothetical protein
MLARRNRVFVWMSPLLILSWASLALLDPDPIADEFIFLGYFFGSLFAHATLAAAWTALGPGTLAWRFPLSLAWAVSLPLAVGINIGLNGGPNDGVVIVGGCLLGQWLALQFPLWALALGLGLRLRHSDDVQRSANGNQIRFGIRHLLIVMLIVGVVLGVGRVTVTSLRVSSGSEVPIFAFLAVAAIVVTLPLLLSALMPRLAAPGVLLALLLMALATAGEMPLLDRLGFSGPETYHFIAINVASAALILASALIVRWNGYRLYARSRSVEPGRSD